MSTDVKTNLTECLRELHLPTFRSCFEETARRAERDTLSYEQYLLELAERECEDRSNNRITRLLKQSGLPFDKTLETFDQTFPHAHATPVGATLYQQIRVVFVCSDASS